MVRTARLLALALALRLPAAAHADRAIWTWEEESYAMLDQPAAADAAIAFLHAKGIDTLFLYADAYRTRNLLVTHPERYRHLIRRLRGAGIRTYALLGSAHRHTERYVLPEYRADALEMVQRVLTYNAATPADERFDGINLDIEPHILPQWERDRETLLTHFLDLGAAIMELKRTYGQTLAIGPAIPFWLDGIALEWQGRRRPTSEHVQDTWDYVALMDYRDRADGPDGIVRHAQDELAYGAKIGRSVMIGVETTPNEIQKVSFNHLKEADLERELGKARQAFTAQPAFGGFVIHDYRGYRRWLDAQK